MIAWSLFVSLALNIVLVYILASRWRLVGESVKLTSIAVRDAIAARRQSAQDRSKLETQDDIAILVEVPKGMVN